jgi:hypothetical protein
MRERSIRKVNMTADTSVLAFLATRFATHPENLATEALNFVVANSPSARRAMLDLCRQLGHRGTDDLAFTTQQSNEDGSRPDLVGRAIDGSTPVAIEAKFWAGLTGHQPLSYLKALPENGFLLFVAPGMRIDVLWPELLRRAENKGAAPDEKVESREARAAQVGSQTLALVSWRTLLDHLYAASALAGEATTADIRQLAALCDKMDTDAFLPLRPEELTSNLGQRVYQFCELADAILNRLVTRGFANVNGFKSVGGKGWYGKYLRARGHGAMLYFDAQQWGANGASPLWLALYGRELQPCTDEANYLRAAGITFHMHNGHCMVPIMLLEGAERDAVIDHAQAQVQRAMLAVPDLGDSHGASVFVPADSDVAPT